MATLEEIASQLRQNGYKPSPVTDTSLEEIGHRLALTSAAGRIQEMNELRDAIQRPRLNESETEAVMNAHRVLFKQEPTKTISEIEYNQAKQTRESRGVLGNLSAGAFNAITSIYPELVGVVNPEEGQRLQTGQQLTANIQPGVAATIGEIAGGVGMMAFTGSAVAIAEAGLGGVGRERITATEARRKGLSVSGGEEALSATAAGVVDTVLTALLFKTGAKAARSVQAAILPSVREALAKEGLTSAKKIAVMGVTDALKAGGISLGQYLADTGIAHITDPTIKTSLEGAIRAGATGALLPVGMGLMGAIRGAGRRGIAPEVGPAEQPAPTEAVIPATPAGIAPEHRQAFIDAAKQAKEIIPIVGEEIYEARSRIAGAMVPKIRSMQEKGVATEEAIKRSIPPGELTEYTQRFPSMRDKLPDGGEAYYKQIVDTLEPLGERFAIRDTQRAFTKLIDGSYLTLTEAGYLAKVFGKTNPEIMDAAKSRVPMGDKIWRTVQEIVNIPFTTLTSIYDVSGLGRQGRFLAQRWPTLAPEFVKVYAKAFSSEEYATKVEADIRTSPNYRRGKRFGLELTEMPTFFSDPATTEETKLASPLLERVPILGKYAIRPTTRSFTAALNWYRMAVVDRMVSAADRTGKPLTDKQFKRLCSDINDLSGRSTLPKALTSFLPFMNALFAPRFTTSRVKLLGKGVYRPNVAAAWVSLIGTNFAVMGLVKMLHPDTEIEPDLRSPDGGKLKIGNVRYDLWAGELPYIRTMFRLATGETKSTSGHIRPLDYKNEMLNILRSRENPMWSLITDAITGSTYIGEKFGAPPRGVWGKKLTSLGIPEWLQGAGKETWNRLGPLTMQDTVDAITSEGLLAAIPATLASASGTGVQTYPEKTAVTVEKVKNQLAKQAYNRPWEELIPQQQKILTAKSSQLRELEAQSKFERTGSFGTSTADELEKSGRRIAGRLTPEIKTLLDGIQIRIGGVGRYHPGGALSKDRYAEYERLTIDELNANIKRITSQPSWEGRSTEQKRLAIDKIELLSKERAKQQLYARMIGAQRGG
jgi:hypothetical protein